MAEGLTCTSDPRNGFSVPASSDGSLFQRRIEFHPGRKAFTGFSNGSGDFFLEALNPSLGSQNPASNVGTSSSTGKKSEDGDVFEHGLDPELSFGITFRRIGAGLENLGNTCFLNSVLQCLTYTEPFAAYLQSGKHQSSCHIAGFCAMCAIQNHVRRALQSTGRILAPKDLVMNLRCISQNFRNARQEDAHEYMVNLLESMHKCCLPSGVPSESPSAYEKSLVHKIFGGRLRSQVKCMQCSYCSNTFDPFLDLSLEIDKADSLHKALRHFTAIEQLDGGERHYQCQRCKQKVIALKQLTVHRAPYVLTIHLKRFGSYVPGEKIDKKVEFGPTLDFKPFVSDSYEGNLKYTLYGVLVHAGWSTHSGHYYCYVRTSSGMWYSLDDNQVVQVSERTVLEQKAYMLFYVRDRRSLMPKKSVDVFNKENIVTNIIENNKCSSSSLGLKGTVQNVLIERRLCTSECSVTSAQRDALGGGSAKHPSLKEPSVKSNGLVMAEGSVVLEDLLLEPSLKEPLLKDPVKRSPVLHYTNGKFESNGATVAPGGVKTDPGNKHDESKKDLSSPFAKPLDCNLSQKCGPEKLVTDKIGLLNEKVLGKIPSERGSKQKSEKKYCALRLSDQSTIVNNQNGVISNEKDSSGTPCLKAGESSSILTKNGLVEISRQSSMQGVHCQKEALDRQDHQKVPKPKKKLVKCRVSKMFLGSNKIFRTTLSLRKKKKHKRSKRHAVELRCFTQEDFLGEKCIAGGLGPSTSEKTRIIALDSTHSQKQASRSDANKANGYVAGKGVRVSDGDSLINNVDGDFRSRISLNNAVLATNEPPQKSSDSMLAANQLDAGEPVSSQEKKKGLDQSGLMSMLMRGLEEAKVAHWDGIKLPHTQILGSSSAQSVSIRYVPDEWDEEYDRGKRKKVRSSKNSFGGPNPFQEVATTKAQLKKAKMDQNSSGNRPYRI